MALRLSLTSPGNAAPAAVQWTFAYASSEIASLSVTPGSATLAAGKSLYCAQGQGAYKCLVVGLTGSTIGNGDVAVATITLTQTAATAVIRVTDVSAVNGNGGATAISGAIGTITTANSSGSTPTPVQSAPSIAAVVCTPSVLMPSASTNCGAILSAPAPAAVTVSVNVSSPILTAPASISIPAGAQTAAFTVTAGPIGANQNATVTAAVNGTVASATLQLQAAAQSTFTPVRVNAGGPAVTDSAGRQWSADTGFSGGNSFVATSPISGAESPVYQSAHWNSGPFQYEVAVPNGVYLVNLKFAETYYNATGRRRFGVTINGQAALTDFDIVAAAGGGAKAVDRQFTTLVGNGRITIQFQPGLADYPMVNGIEILSAGRATVTVTPQTVSLGPSQTQQFSAAVAGVSNTAVKWSVSPSLGTISTAGLYTAPMVISAGQDISLVAASVEDPTSTAAAMIDLTPGPVGAPSIRVNAGGPAVTDSAGRQWSADTGFSGGNSFVATWPISGAESPVYQSAHWNSGPFQYDVAVPNGVYLVNLKFAETYYNATGRRRFGVTINGQAALTDFDIVAAAGGAAKAVDRQFTTTVASGRITIQFQPGAADYPMVNGIEILPTGPARMSVTPKTTSIEPAPTSASEAISVAATSAGAPTTSASAAMLVPVNAGFAPIRVNAGGLAIRDSAGQQWSADTGFLGGNSIAVGSPAAESTSDVYQSARWNSGSFRYEFTVPNGVYTVNLKFAEIYFNGTGQRRFGVRINNQPALTEFDIVAAAGGPSEPIDRQFTTVVTNERITIEFQPGTTDYPMVNGIEILLTAAR